MSSFVDSGASLVLSIWFVLALVLNSKKIILAKLIILVGCGVADELFTCSQMLVKNRLHGKAAELCLANS